MCMSVCYFRWRADVSVYVGFFCRMCVWNVRGWRLSVMDGCIMERRQCLIRIADILLEMSTVSAKNLSCLGFDGIGSWFSACLSANCWSPLPLIMVLYSHQMPYVEVGWILCMLVALFFSATTVNGVGAPEFPLFGHFCWCVLWEDCWPASDWIVVLPGMGLHDPLESIGDAADSFLYLGCLVWPSSWLPWWSVCTVLPCRLIGVFCRGGDVLKTPSFSKFFKLLRAKVGSIVVDKPFRDSLFSQDLLDNIDDFIAGEFP